MHAKCAIYIVWNDGKINLGDLLTDKLKLNI